MVDRSRVGSVGRIALYALLIAYGLTIVYPLFIMVSNSVKTGQEIFANPFSLPSSFVWDNYGYVWSIASFNAYLKNSVLVTAVSVFLVLAVSSAAAFALARYRFTGNTFLYLFFLSGLMLPIRLGIIPLFILMKNLNLLDTYASLILTYTASAIPFAVFILTGFFKALPKELEFAARIDGCNEYRIYYQIMLPLVRPALATVAIFNFVQTWNDFFIPLVFISSDHLKTVPLGMTNFFGQYQTDWNYLFAGLTLATLPTLIMYLFMSKQFIKGLTAGAVKG